MYKGYLKGSDKKTVEKFKDHPENLVKWDTARRYNSFVGVLEDDYVMLDIDTPEESDLLLDIIEGLKLQCSVLETSKGIHVYFKGHDLTANKIGWYSPIGINVTTKLGSKNTVDPLKIDGEYRTWLRRCNNPQPIPKWLYPMDKRRNYIPEIGEGSRNQELFNYILKLQSVGMSKADIKETIKIINTYVLDEPLPKSEIDIILRDEAFMKESFFKNNSFLHDKFGDFLISEHHIVRIYDVLHIYIDGVYSDNTHDIERAMIKHLKMLTKARRQEVLAYLQLEAPVVMTSDIKYVAVNNGILNLETWQLQEFTPTIVIKNKIPVNYVSDAYYDVTDNTLDKLACHEKSLRYVMEEIFGYILLRRNEIGKMFILTGDGSNGKSSFLNMIRQFTGESNTSALDLKELDKQFKTAELFGKLMNIGDDISGEYIKENSVMKKLTTGEPVNVERKGKDPFDLKSYAKLIFSANKVPRINDTSGALRRRLLIIPFNATFSPTDSDFDPFISDKLMSQQSMEYLLQLAINGLKRILKNNKFSTSKTITAELSKYEEENNPIITFLKDDDLKIENESTGDVYRIYQVWCVDNGYKSLGNIQFSREVCRQTGLTTERQRVEGKRKYFFVKE